MVPTWVVLREPAKTIVTFGIHGTPQSTAVFAKHLGLKMSVFTAKLMDNKNVHITKLRPHQSGHASIAKLTPIVRDEDLNQDVKTTIRMNIDSKLAIMSGLTGRLEFLSKDAKSSLLSGATVKVAQSSPASIAATLGEGHNSKSYNLTFPIPILSSQSKTRIARKSAYIEIDVPTADYVSRRGFPNFMYPLTISSGIAILRNLPYLNLACLPAIDITRKPKTLEWLSPHTALQMSARERAAREKSLIPGLGSSIIVDVRSNFKDSLFSLFMHFSGIQGGKANIFGLKSIEGDCNVRILILVSRMLLDIANHTTVLGCAIILLTRRNLPDLKRHLFMLPDKGYCNIKVDKDEMMLWREVLPAMVERCRDWRHKPACEYRSDSKIPLSNEEDRAQVICSCGSGMFPEKFITGIASWGSLSKFARGAAISPTFSVPSVKRTVDTQNLPMSPAITCGRCCKEKGSDVSALSRCARCLGVWYCSTECQREDWKAHKKVCKPAE